MTDKGGDKKMKSTALFDLAGEYIRENLPALVAENLQSILDERQKLTVEVKELNKKLKAQEHYVEERHVFKARLEQHKDLAEARASLGEKRKALETDKAQFEKEKLEAQLALEKEKADWSLKVAERLLDKVAGGVG